MFSFGNGLKKYNTCKLKSSKFSETIPASFNRGVIVVSKVRIGGINRELNFILDSGSEYSFISDKVANEIGFSPFFSEVITDGFEKRNFQLGLLDFHIGSIEFNEVGVGIMNSSQMEKMCDIDGYIGYNLMKSCIWKLGTSEIVITDKIKNIEGLNKFYKQKLFNGPTVEAGFVNGFNSTMLFDLGDNGTVEIQESRIELIKNKQITTGIGELYTTGFGNGKKSEKSIHKLLKVPGFKFGGDTVNNMIVYTDNAPQFPIDIIGAGILNYYNIILDFPGKRLYSQNMSNEYLNQGFKTCGFKYNFINKEIIIKFIWDDSVAQKAGLKIGQKIELINNIKINDLIELRDCEIYQKIDSLLKQKQVSIKIQGEKSNIILNKSPLFTFE
jgi:hypothetical protein